MRIKNYLRGMSDTATVGLIEHDYPADWDMDAIFERSYKRFLMAGEQADMVESAPVEVVENVRRFNVNKAAIVFSAALLLVFFRSLNSVEPPDKTDTPLPPAPVDNAAVPETSVPTSASGGKITVTSSAAEETTFTSAVQTTTTETTCSVAEAPEETQAPEESAAETVIVTIVTSPETTVTLLTTTTELPTTSTTAPATAEPSATSTTAKKPDNTGYPRFITREGFIELVQGQNTFEPRDFDRYKHENADPDGYHLIFEVEDAPGVRIEIIGDNAYHQYWTWVTYTDEEKYRIDIHKFRKAIKDMDASDVEISEMIKTYGTKEESS